VVGKAVFSDIVHTGVYSLFSAATALRLRSKAGDLNQPASVPEKLVIVRKRLRNLKQATLAAFYFSGFVLFAAFQSAYFVSVNTKMPIGWIVLEDFQAHFAFAGNAFFLFLILHLIQWSLERRVNTLLWRELVAAPLDGAQRRRWRNIAIALKIRLSGGFECKGLLSSTGSTSIP